MTIAAAVRMVKTTMMMKKERKCWEKEEKTDNEWLSEIKDECHDRVDK
jgi:hypothetical protein